MKIKNYEEVIALVKKGELKYPIPTYKLNRFFFLREKEDTLVVVDLNGKTHKITERIFDKSCKKIKLAQSDHKIKSSQNNKYVYSILRELEGYDDYTPIRWIKIANKIRSVKFEDFLEFLRSKENLEYLEKFEAENVCRLFINKDSISILQGNDTISFLCLTDFESTKEKICNLLNGSASLEDILGSLGNITDIYNIIKGIRKGDYTKIISSIIGYIIGNSILPSLGGSIGKTVGEQIGGFLNQKYNIDNKIKKSLEELFKHIIVKSLISTYIENLSSKQ